MTLQTPTHPPHPLAPATQEQLTAARTEATRPGAFSQPGALTPTGIGTTDASAPVPVGAAPRPAGVAPYHCDTCGASSPYQGMRPVRKGGNGCKACGAVEKQIAARQRAAYSAISTAAYQPGVCGDEKRAILARAIEVSSRAWRDAQIAFGIDLGREDRLALATALTDAGNALLDAGQDVALAADRQVAA